MITPARGEHLVETDLIAALDTGRLGGAVLDLLAREPLPPQHAFWRDPKVLVTPARVGLRPDGSAS